MPLSNTKRQGLLLGLLLFGYVLYSARSANLHRMGEVLTTKSDQRGYYQYLPALLGVHPWKQLPYSHHLDDYHWLDLFTVGTAYLQLPFFLGAVGVSKINGWLLDGYSDPFVYGQFTASAFYLAMGCVLLFHALRRAYGATVAIVTTLLVFFGTNLYFYAILETGMSHVYAFFVAWLFYLIVRMKEKPSGIRLFGLIVCSGLLVLIRPMNAVALLFPLLYGGPIREGLLERLQWLRRFRIAAAAGTLTVVALWLPQLRYWHLITGKWLVFTYGKKDEGFTWTDPHLFDVLFSHQNGWFIYTPLMVLVMGVLLWHVWQNRSEARLVFIVWVLVWYVYSSWWCWWLGGAFGHRGFVEYYVLLAIPLAWAIAWLFRRPRVVREVAFICLGLIVFLNMRLGRIYQWPWEGPDWTWQDVSDVYLQALWG